LFWDFLQDLAYLVGKPSRGHCPAAEVRVLEKANTATYGSDICTVVSCHKLGKMRLPPAVAHYRITTKPGQGGIAEVVIEWT